MSDVVHRLIARSYDVAMSKLTANELMVEIADSFSAAAVALVVRDSNFAVRMLCSGIGSGQTGAESLAALKRKMARRSYNLVDNRWLSVCFNRTDTLNYILFVETIRLSPHIIETIEKKAARVLPHVVRSVEMLSRSRVRRQQAEDVARRLGANFMPAMIILDSEQRVDGLNARAEELLSSCSAIRQQDDRLEFEDVSESTRFSEVFLRTLADENCGPHFLTIGGKDELIFLLQRNPKLPQEIVLKICRLRNTPAITPEMLARDFALTRKESRLAAGLLQGRKLSELSDAFHVSEHTLRAQTKSIFRKTGMKSQAALIVKLLDHYFAILGVEPTQINEAG